MLSFELEESKVDADRFVRGLRIIKPAVSLGGIESTICAPAVTSHAKISAAERLQDRNKRFAPEAVRRHRAGR